jgi:hypothetical protein
MPSGSARPVRGPRPHDVICQTRMRNARGANATAPPCITVGLPHPIPDALGRGFELPSELLGRPPFPHQLGDTLPESAEYGVCGVMIGVCPGNRVQYTASE